MTKYLVHSPFFQEGYEPLLEILKSTICNGNHEFQDFCYFWPGGTATATRMCLESQQALYSAQQNAILIQQRNRRRARLECGFSGKGSTRPMPDVQGWGSHIQISPEGIEIGPKSLGNQTFSLAMAFGGKQLTLTDVALALGYIDIPRARPKMARAIVRVSDAQHEG